MRRLRFRARFEWKGADTWLGAYWSPDGTWASGTVWICLLPCVPLKIDWWHA
jgi:hypothetical protein